MTNQEKIELVKELFTRENIPFPEDERELITIYDDLIETDSKSSLPVNKNLNFHPTIRFSENELGKQHTRLGTYFKKINFSDGTSWMIAKSSLISRSYSGYPDGGFLAPQPEYHKLFYASKESLYNSFKNVKGLKIKQDNSGLRAWSKSSKYDRDKKTKEKRLVSQPVQKIKPPKANRHTKKANPYGGTAQSSTAVAGNPVSLSKSFQTRAYKDNENNNFHLEIQGCFVTQVFSSTSPGLVMKAYYLANGDIDFSPYNFRWDEISQSHPFLKAIEKLKKRLSELKHKSDESLYAMLKPDQAPCSQPDKGYFRERNTEIYKNGIKEIKKGGEKGGVRKKPKNKPKPKPKKKKGRRWKNDIKQNYK